MSDGLLGGALGGEDEKPETEAPEALAGAEAFAAAGALTKLQAANQRGPHWTDPLKAWGDALVKQGQLKEALTKYGEALKYAPNWAELKQARDTTASKLR